MKAEYALWNGRRLGAGGRSLYGASCFVATTQNRGRDEARRRNDLDRRIRQAIRVDATGVEAKEAQRERGKTDYVGP
jgi:hypothetical protein